jgi:hypothetical protein
MGKFNISNPGQEAIMGRKKSDFLEVLAEMSEYAGILFGTAVIAGKKAIRYVNDLTIVETHIKPPTDPVKDNNDIKRAKS